MGTGVSLYTNKKTRQFVIQIRYQGKRFFETFSSDREEEAQLRKKALELELKRLRPGQTPTFLAARVAKRTNPDGTPKDTNPLLKQPIEKIWKFFEQTKKARLAHNTFQTYRTAWNSFKKNTDCVLIGDIKSTTAADFITNARKAKLDTTSINIYMKHLRAIFNNCLKHQWTIVNPFIMEKLLPDDNKRYAYLTIEEVNKILKEAEKVSEDILLVFSLGIFLGLRVREILAARWEWITFQSRLFTNGVITVESESGTDENAFRTKSRKMRSIPLEENLAEILANSIMCKALKEMDDGTHYVDMLDPEKKKEYAEAVKQKMKGYIVKPENKTQSKRGIRWDFRKAFNRVLKNAGCEKVNRYGVDETVTCHTLRHTFASLFAQQGLSATKIQEYAGHSDPKITRCYIHLAPHDENFNIFGPRDKPNSKKNNP